VALAMSADEFLLLVIATALVTGIAAGLASLRWWMKAALFFAAPVAAVVVYKIINPDPGCTYDCPGKLVWGLVLIYAVCAWWVGLGGAIFSRWLIRELRAARRENRVS
jgi:hypothetical protein